MERTTYRDLENCLRLANDDVELVATTAQGPRILEYKFKGGENVLGWHPAAKIPTALGEYRILGGHRLWIAPERVPETYAPDDDPVEFSYDAARRELRLVQPVEPVTQTQKELVVTLDAAGSGVTLAHRVTNRGAEPRELAAWALTIMRGGGTCEIPNEPFAPYGPATLLPVRSLAVWSYTDLADPRWSFTREAIRLRVDETRPDPQKIGVRSRQGVLRYILADAVFTKTFAPVEGAAHPDLDSNCELYAAGSFVEVETLGPLVRLAPGASTEHVERWHLEQT